MTASPPPSIATNIDGITQYNFRLFRDCNSDGVEDTTTGACQSSSGCPADVDNGTMTGHPDGGVTIDDLLYYLEVFDRGWVEADVDDGNGTGTHDGGVTIDDLLYFLARFDAGC